MRELCLGGLWKRKGKATIADEDESVAVDLRAARWLLNTVVETLLAAALH